MKRAGIAAAAFIAFATALSKNAVAMAEASLPPEQHQGAISFVAGGNGRNIQAFERAAADYPLALELLRRGARRDGFLPGAQVTLRDLRGKEVLSAFLDGPFLLARVPAGHYVASVTYGGKVLRRPVLVKRRDNQRIVLEWPNGG